MKRLWLLAVLALLLASPAAAAPACFPNMSPPTFIDIDGTPKLGEVVYTASTVGLVWGYTCKDSAGAWWKVIAYGNWEQFPRDWLFILDTAIRGTDADRRTLWDKYAVASTIDQRLQADWVKIQGLLPNPPPVTAWKVLADPFRADKKRIVYAVVNGKRGLVTARYVDAGAPCDPVVTIAEFGGVFFLSVLGDPALVARCVKQ